MTNPEAVITSNANAHVKRVRRLQADRRERQLQECFIIEGISLACEAIDAQTPIEEAFYTPNFEQDRNGATVLALLKGRGAALFPVAEQIMHSMAETHTPQGVLAIVPFVHLPVPDMPSFSLIIDAVHDPGNLGAILRLAVGAAIPVIYLAPGTVDITNPKVVRSGMGAHFRVSTIDLSWGEIGQRVSAHQVYLADSHADTPHFEVDWTQPCALIVSDEANGASSEAVRMAHARVTVPMPGKADSLNVAMATGILIYEMIRQRMYS